MAGRSQLEGVSEGVQCRGRALVQLLEVEGMSTGGSLLIRRARRTAITACRKSTGTDDVVHVAAGGGFTKRTIRDTIVIIDRRLVTYSRFTETLKLDFCVLGPQNGCHCAIGRRDDDERRPNKCSPTSPAEGDLYSSPNPDYHHHHSYDKRISPSSTGLKLTIARTYSSSGKRRIETDVMKMCV